MRIRSVACDGGQLPAHQAMPQSPSDRLGRPVRAVSCQRETLLLEASHWMSNEGSTDGEPQANPEVTAPRMAQSSPDAAAQPERSAIEFPPTRWTWVLEAAEGDEAKAQQAMAELCDHYR